MNNEDEVKISTVDFVRGYCERYIDAMPYNIVQDIQDTYADLRLNIHKEDLVYMVKQILQELLE